MRYCSSTAAAALSLCSLAAAVPHGKANGHFHPSSTPVASSTPIASPSATPSAFPAHNLTLSGLLAKPGLGLSNLAVNIPTGDWANVQCSDNITSASSTADGRWANAQAANAWEALKTGWTSAKAQTNPPSFLQYVQDFIGAPATIQQCGSIGVQGGCTVDTCPNYKSPAGYLLMTSFSTIKSIEDAYYSSISYAGTSVEAKVGEFTSVFTAEKSDSAAARVGVDVLMMLFTLGSAGTFNYALKEELKHLLPGLQKDVVNAMAISFSANMIKDNLPTSDPVATQNALSSSLGDYISDWRKVDAAYLTGIFSGSDEGLEILEALMLSGHMLAMTEGMTGQSLTQDMERILYGQLISEAWIGNQRTYPIVVKGDKGCLTSSGSAPSVINYLSGGDLGHSAYCYGEYTYYLLNVVIQPDTVVKHEFSVLPGATSLGSDGKYGSITVGEIIESALKGYEKNGNQNGYKMADATEVINADDADQPLKFPSGFFSFPVCEDLTAAYWAVQTRWTKREHGESVNYGEFWPCDTPEGYGASTTLRVNKGYIDVNDDVVTDSISIPKSGSDRNNATVYAQFDGSQDLPEMVVAGCELSISWPDNYGDIFWGADDCLYDSDGKQIVDEAQQGQCCSGHPSTKQVKNPYHAW
ncbi:hypothetical protein FE257_005008 [Aspergillus nanangensis]|uniref:Uncharacterized protein n=1 Tax=Aspergillus nanangensis TaxID=2582783 RepID=A0AAD4GX10_ASPNN|nr:hypothetical protein FE257_005008 [Aspergillus nanangensis]